MFLDEVCAVYGGVECQEQQTIHSIMGRKRPIQAPFNVVTCDNVVKNISVSEQGFHKVQDNI